MRTPVPEGPAPVLSRSAEERWLWSWLAAAWALLFVAASYGWRFGEYYEHGWFVPPLAAWMLWRRARTLGQPRHAQLFPAWLLVAVLALTVIILVPIRVLERVDPRWALPLWLHGIAVGAATHALVARAWGLPSSLRLIPWTLFALSALALPTIIERNLVATLTSLVLVATQTLLESFGMFVEVAGDRLLVDGMDVAVTEGCSGIRSGHAFLMASLFFGEFMALSWQRRIGLLGLAVLTAWVVNVARATTLAVLRFQGGAEAMNQWHDTAGFAAYVVGSLILLAIAARLELGQRSGRRIRTLVRTSSP